MMDKAALNLLGIARKAGRVEIGELPVSAAARGHKARLILTASDAAPNTIRQVSNLPGNAVILSAPYDKAELGAVLGRASCAVLAVTEARLALAIAEKIAAVTGDMSGLPELEAKARRVGRRQEENKAHLRNKRKK